MIHFSTIYTNQCDSIKPNTFKQAKVMNQRETMNQLESAGVVTAITISRETFPNRLSYDAVWNRFSCLGSTKDSVFSFSFQYNGEKGRLTDILKENVQRLLSQTLTTLFRRADGMHVLSFACGKTKVYFRTGALEQLESDRTAFYSVNATIIQTWARQKIASYLYRKKLRDIIITQSLVRRFITYTRYRNMRKSIIMVQTQVRCMVARRSYHQKMTSAIMLQSWLRCHSSRKTFKKVIYSVLEIQRFLRGMMVRKFYVLIKSSIIKIQSVWRACSNQRSYYEIKKSTLTIQCFWRQSFAKAIMLQRRRLATDLMLLKKHTACVIIIQRWFRGANIRWRYLELRRLVVLIQAVMRGVICRKANRFLSQRKMHHSKAILLQKFFKNFIIRTKFKATCKATLKIQAWIRCLNAQAKYNVQREAIIIIQSFVRGANLQRFKRKSILASIRIQSIWRQNVALHSYRYVLTSIITIQAKYRGFVVRRNLETLRCATIKIQSMTRMKINMESYRVMKSAIIELQAWFRRFSAERSYHTIRTSAIIIQRAFHNLVERRHHGDVAISCNDHYDVTLSSSFPKEIILDRQMTDSQKDETEEEDVVQLLQEKISRLENENNKLKSEVRELDDDKQGLVHHAHCLEVTLSHLRLRCNDLIKTNKALISEITERKHESADLRREMQLFENRKESEILALQRQCGKMLFKRETEISALKHAANTGLNATSVQLNLLEAKFNKERENHLSEIHALKEKLQKTQDTHSGYMEKILDVLEASHSARESEVRKLKRELRQVREEKDREINTLKERIDALQCESTISSNMDHTAMVSRIEILKRAIATRSNIEHRENNSLSEATREKMDSRKTTLNFAHAAQPENEHIQIDGLASSIHEPLDDDVMEFLEDMEKYFIE